MFYQQRGIIRESNQSNTAWNQISHFSTQLTWCNRVRWLKYKHFCAEWLYKCVGSWQQPAYCRKSAEWHLSLWMSAIFCHYTVWYFGVILLKSQLGDTQAISTSYPSTVYLLSENVCILGKAGVSQNQHSHNPICPMRNAHLVLPNMAWSLVLTPALYYTRQRRRIISWG